MEKRLEVKSLGELTVMGIKALLTSIEGKDEYGYDILNLSKLWKKLDASGKWISEKSLKQWISEFPNMDDPKYWTEPSETLPKIEGKKPERVFMSLRYVGDVLNWKKQLEKELK